MRRLSETVTSVYEQFANRNFSIKEKPGRFTAVGGDQKLEQSIDLSSKCNTSVIGQAKKKQFIAQCGLIYQEMKAPQNIDRHYTNAVEKTHDAFFHHDASQLVNYLPKRAAVAENDRLH